MSDDSPELYERRILLERCFSIPRLFEIGRSLRLPYFKDAQSGWGLDENQVLYELASGLSDDQLKDVFRRYSPWTWAQFRGSRYTFENGRLSMKGSWEPLRISLRAFLKRHGEAAKDALEVISRSLVGVSVQDLEKKISRRHHRTDLNRLLDELSQEGLIVPAYRSERYTEWMIPEELIPQMQSEVRGEPPLYPSMETKAAPAAAGGKGGEPVDYLAAERLRVEAMDREFDSYLQDLLKNRLEATVAFGKAFSITALADYLQGLFGSVLYFDSFLSIAQQYGLADISIRSEATRGSVGLRTGFNLALFGEPGTGKSYSTRDMILGKSDGSVPPHGLPGRNRYAAGMTPARFIRIGQVYSGLTRNFIVPEFNDWFRSEGMVEILKLAMERGEIRYELHREVVGPYRFGCFFSVNYNTQVFGRGYKATVSDPNFQAIEDRMICRLHRLTKQRYEEIAQSRLRMVLGETSFGETAQKIRDHLTLVHAIEIGHPLVKDRFPAKPPLITRLMLDTVRKTREAILESLPSEGVPFSARLEDRSIRLASALSLMEYFRAPGEFVPIGREAQEYAARFYVEEAAVRSGVDIDPKDVLGDVGF